MAKPSATDSPDTNLPMSAAQADELKRLAVDAYEPDAFQTQLTAAEADVRIETLKAKLPLLDSPPHPL